MSRLNKDTLSIDEIWTNNIERDGEKIAVIGINWSCNLGFGEYELIFNEKDGTIEGMSECMDSNEDKEFLRALFDKIIKKVDIVD